MKLLVSVRSATEALAALQGGADLIDVKEPLHGPLGRADDSVIAEISNAVAGGRPISAAMSELKDTVDWVPPSCALDYIKFGLAGCQRLPWDERLLELQHIVCRDAESSERSDRVTCVVVPCAYADAERAEAPPVEDVAAFAIQHKFPILLIDTYRKDGRDLFDWMLKERLFALVKQLREAGVAVALAGSLTERQIPMVKKISPAWLAVRGAACLDGKRDGQIDLARVRTLKLMLSN